MAALENFTIISIEYGATISGGCFSGEPVQGRNAKVMLEQSNKVWRLQESKINKILTYLKTGDAVMGVLRKRKRSVATNQTGGFMSSSINIVQSAESRFHISGEKAPLKGNCFISRNSCFNNFRALTSSISIPDYRSHNGVTAALQASGSLLVNNVPATASGGVQWVF